MARIKNDYFKFMEEQAACSVEASNMLKNIIKNISPVDLPAQRDNMHQIERKADKIQHDIIIKLSTEFITPIDQEDILRLVQINEDLTDSIDEVVQDIYMYHVATTPMGAAELAELVDNCVVALSEAVEKLRDFKKTDSLRTLLDKVSEIEEKADEVYAEAVHNLFMNETEAKILIGHKAVLDALEACCDLCDHACNIMDQIIIKNT